MTPEEQMDVESPPGLQEEPGGGPDGVPPEHEIQEDPSWDQFESTMILKGSKIKDLRTACAWLGISQSGGKQRLFGRIREAHVKGLRRAAVEIANKEYLQAAHQAEPAHVASRQPSSRERMLHELAHLPYRDWCPHCVATRSRGDYHASVADPVSTSERDHPIVQMDFFFCEERGGASILLMIDACTRYVHVEPTEKKTAKAVGEALSRFIGMVGHLGMVELCSDNEPTLVAGMQFCRSIRSKHGFPTTIYFNQQAL